MSWGHDEYLYHVFKNYLPEPALYMIRYHSFYAWHREGAYDWLCDDHDREMLHHVQGVQSVRSVFQKSAAAGLERAASVLLGIDSEILSGQIGFLTSAWTQRTEDAERHGSLFWTRFHADARPDSGAGHRILGQLTPPAGGCQC